MSERVLVTVAFPCDLDLFLKIGMTVVDSHDQTCDAEGCRVFIRGLGQAGASFVHGIPIVIEEITAESSAFVPSRQEGA